jgi:uncharacterized protein
MSNEFLGVGWQFPVGTDSDSRVAIARHEEAVAQSIWTILATAPGERVMRPDFGCGIYDLVFAVNSAGTAEQVATQVRRALLRWEPRIDLDDVQVTSNDTGDTLLISVEYRVRATNSRFNLVYPFYLERTAG